MKTMPPSCLTLSNLTVRYGSNIVLKNISGNFEKGSLTAIVGPNGGGKTTLLKTFMGFTPSSKGTFINASHKTAYLPQRSEIDLHFPLTVEQVVSFGLWPKIGSTRALRPEHIHQITSALNDVGMSSYKKAYIHTLSGGQLQRILFARLILQDADLILLDEPFTAIDSKTTHDLMEIVKKWHQEDRTIVAVLHDIELVKYHFPQTLLLSTEIMGWGETKTTLTAETLQKIHVCAHSFTFNE